MGDRAGPFESVSPLPGDVRRSLVAMVAVGMTSLLTTALLLVQITYGLVCWKLRDLRRRRRERDRERDRAAGPAPAPAVDLQLGLTEAHYYCYHQARRGKADAATAAAAAQQQQQQQQQQQHAGERRPAGAVRREKPPNPLLVLIYNLLLADTALSAAYANDAIWLARDAIVAPSRACSAQGWTVSFGCLTTSGFLFTISVFSYLGVIRGYKATRRDVLAACAAVWTLSVVLASVGPIHFRHDHDGFYGRQTDWCWIHERHKLWRLLVYLWGVPLMCGSGCIYALIFYKLWREGRSSRFMPRRRAGSSSTTDDDDDDDGDDDDDNNTNNTDNNRRGSSSSTPLRPSGHHPAFLIYPCIYMVTGTPLVVGSLVPSLERSPAFMGAAGVLLASTGLLDTLLWSSIVLFSRREDLRNTGLDRFAFVRTPEGRTLGNIVLVQGGGGGGPAAAAGAAEGGRGSLRPHRRYPWWHPGRGGRRKKEDGGWWRLGDRQGEQPSSLSRERLPEVREGIQMEVVTTVVVEMGPTVGQRPRNFSRDEDKSMQSMQSM